MISRLLILVALFPLSAIADAPQTPHCFDQSVGTEQLRKGVSETSFETFESLEPGMARETIVDLVGVPTYLCGSGIAYDVYVLGDGKEVSIAYIDGSSAWAFVSDDEDSERRLLFGKSDEE